MNLRGYIEEETLFCPPNTLVTLGQYLPGLVKSKTQFGCGFVNFFLLTFESRWCLLTGLSMPVKDAFVVIE